ncbi:ROK family protein [Nakamurella sp. YIM 132087]|uniref:ROK family protein n=1 Tax=Nakamurella alba TaxID=2665158 RepID=A0A7K1FTF0_9ACTN|nr:ROK family protein [Nakamurella alba]MTD17370.1 ROK family protein [Nakamurella alba]
MSTQNASYTIGLDIGGTSVRAAVVDADCRIVDSRHAPTPHTVEETEKVFAELILDLASVHPVRAVGLAVAGFVTADRTAVMFAPHLAWRGDPVPQRISDLVGMPVVMDHDVNSAAWAEYRRGSARSASIALLVAIGTGIGAGLIVDGEIYRGAHGVAPELGHLVLVPGGRPCPCGKRGCWERYCSGTGLADTAREMIAADHKPGLLDIGDPADLTGAMVAKAASAGDQLALRALADLGTWLGRGLAMAADVLDPEVIVIGGGVVGSSEYFLPQAVAEMRAMITGGAHRPEPRVELATFGGSAGIIGAALRAAEL